MSRHLVVVSADPGVTTGWAVHRIPACRLLAEGLVACAGLLRCSVGQFRGGSTSDNVDAFLNLARATYEELTEEGDAWAMVVESFSLRMLSSDPALLEPERFASVLRDRLRGTGQGVEWQQPSEALSTITDARLGLWGLAEHSAGRAHGRDAQRHGLYYARRWSSDGNVRRRSGWVREGVSAGVAS